MLQIARMTGNKKQGRPARSKPPPHGINTPLFMAARRDRIPLAACQIPLLILEYIIISAA